MIKNLLAIAIIIAIIFTGCVGTLVADNNLQRTPNSAIQNAKSTIQQEHDSNIIKKKNIHKKVL